MSPITKALQRTHSAAAGRGSGSLGTTPDIRWGGMAEQQGSQLSRQPQKGDQMFSKHWLSKQQQFVQESVSMNCKLLLIEAAPVQSLY